MQRTSLDFDGLGVDSSKSDVGDVYVGPVVLGWHGAQWDAVFAAGLWLDTADFDARDPASVGRGHRTSMLTLGGAWHFDAERRWSISALSRYERKSEQDHTNITPGDSWLVEWSLSHKLQSGGEQGQAGAARRRSRTGLWLAGSGHGAEGGGVSRVFVEGRQQRGTA